jgi:hypothetical protein
MYVENIIIEVTRRCNLECPHCLRGEAQNMDIKGEHLVNLFCGLKGSDVGSLTLTGGEPSLVPEKIRTIIYLAKGFDVNIHNFYIATNAAKNPKFKDFVMACLELYLYCSENEMSAIHWSNDSYHENDPDNVRLLQALSFSSAKYEEKDGKLRYEPNVIAEGRAKDWGKAKPSSTGITVSTEDDDVQVQGILYLNCRGQIIDDCDWSYANQRYHKICNVNEFSLEKIKEYEKGGKRDVNESSLE